MPKPVRKEAPKNVKHPSSDSILRAKGLMDEHIRLTDQVEAEIVTPDFEVQYSARMKRLGAKGGKIGGKRRMDDLLDSEKSALGLRAATARWDKERAKKKQPK